jgi:hypothetical protein
VPLREQLQARLTDPRKPRGIRRSLVSVLIAGVAITHGTRLVIGQDKAGKANEITHFKPLLDPLPLQGHHRRRAWGRGPGPGDRAQERPFRPRQ